jgi:hypothetical protein
VPYKLRFAKGPDDLLTALAADTGNAAKRRLRKVRKALGQLERDPRHPGLHSHQYESFPVDKDVKVWDSYVENHTPGAWRIFWHYGPDELGQPDEPRQPVITVLAIGPHP